MVLCCSKQPVWINSCVAVQVIYLGMKFSSSTYMPTWSAPSFHIFCKLCLLQDILTYMLCLGFFAHLKHFVCLGWPLPWPMSDVFLLGLIDVFTTSIGNWLVSCPWRKTFCWWTVSDCWINVTGFSRVRSPSNCSGSDNLLLQILTTSISLTISSYIAPKLQYLVMAYTVSIRGSNHVHLLH